MISEWTRKHTKHECMEIIGAAGVPAGAVLDTLELYNDPTFEQRQIMQTVQHPTNGPFKMVGWPVRVASSPARRSGSRWGSASGFCFFHFSLG